jgi:tetratricopeptide (TPR) repeat protein
VCVVVAALSVLAPWLALREVNDAAANWPGGPAQAFDELDRAASLNPLSPLPDLVAGSIALRQEHWAVAERYFRRAQKRESRNQYAELELGLLAARAGRRAEAIQRTVHAYTMSPRDEITQTAFRRVAAGQPVNINDVNRQFAEHAESLVR